MLKASMDLPRMFLTICSVASYPFGFPSRITLPPIDTLKLLVITLRNQDKKVSLIVVERDRALKILFKFMRTCHIMNIIENYR